MNKFWEFVNNNPFISLIIVIVIVDGIVEIVRAARGR